MNPSENIQAELQEISPLLASNPDRKPVFAVPDRYFEDLPALMLAQVTGETDQKLAKDSQELAEISPVLAGLQRKMPYSVPQGFFDEVAIPVKGSILDGLEKTNPYSVPSGYFAAFPEFMLRAVQKAPAFTIPAAPTKTEGKLVPMRNNWLRYAAAAVVAGILAVAGWLYTQQQPALQPMQKNNPQVMAMQLEQELNQLSDEAILDFADSPTPDDITAQTLANNDDELNPADIHFLLEDVSDKALQDFLTEQPGKSGLLNN